MVDGLNLVTIPSEEYNDYKMEVIFEAFKWDAQVHDTNTVSRHILLMDEHIADKLARWAQQLSEETFNIEEALWKNPKLAKGLGIPYRVQKQLRMIKDYKREEHVRLMRYDFHPTDTGWVISEVNSDVPAGMAEASVLPEIARKFCKDGEVRGNIVKSIYEAYTPLIKQSGRMAFVHATSFIEDRQMVSCIGNYFEENGYSIVYAAPNQIAWDKGKAISLVKGYEGEVSGIIRYFPVEWLCNYRFYDWSGYFTAKLPQCNPPIALYSQSKRVPLVWDELGIECETWKSLLPQSAKTHSVTPSHSDWIYKPALGRVGDGVTIPEALSSEKYKKYVKSARRASKHWVAQKRFHSQPVLTEDGQPYHLCVGVFTVNGKFSGFYARTSILPLINDKAIDTPVLIKKEVQ